MRTIPALVLAAGLSRRMGRFKLTLPWGEHTVIGQVVATLEAAGVGEIVVVLGHRAAELALALNGARARTVFNPAYAAGEMLSSMQAAIPALSQEAPALLLCLGDQPQMEAGTVRELLAAGEDVGWQAIIIPSHRMRAGHPIVLPRWLWPEILASQATLRDLLREHREQTRYLTVETPSILADLDTPEDYAQETRLDPV